MPCLTLGGAGPVTHVSPMYKVYWDPFWGRYRGSDTATHLPLSPISVWQEKSGGRVGLADCRAKAWGSPGCVCGNGECVCVLGRVEEGYMLAQLSWAFDPAKHMRGEEATVVCAQRQPSHSTTHRRAKTGGYVEGAREREGERKGGKKSRRLGEGEKGWIN